MAALPLADALMRGEFSEEMVRRQGKLRQQGRAYVVEDGCVFFVKFNVAPEDLPGRAGPAGRRLQRSTQDSDPG